MAMPTRSPTVLSDEVVLHTTTTDRTYRSILKLYGKHPIPCACLVPDGRDFCKPCLAAKCDQEGSGEPCLVTGEGR